ncbi:hypothetical protein VTH82DRAFT_3427 [Thermothelomyces myriococcoides]
MSTTVAAGAPVDEGNTSFTMLDADDEDQQQQQQPQHGQSEGGALQAQKQGWTTGSKHRQVVCNWAPSPHPPPEADFPASIDDTASFLPPKRTV